MDADKVIHTGLKQAFSAPLPEFYKRRIIVWHDEDREFEDRISDITLTDTKPNPIIKEVLKSGLDVETKHLAF